MKNCIRNIEIYYDGAGDAVVFIWRELLPDMRMVDSKSYRLKVGKHSLNRLLKICRDQMRLDDVEFSDGKRIEHRYTHLSFLAKEDFRMEDFTDDQLEACIEIANVALSPQGLRGQDMPELFYSAKTLRRQGFLVELRERISNYLGDTGAYLGEDNPDRKEN